MTFNPNPTKQIFTFGKYKGKTLEEVAQHDPGYIVWAYENTQFKCDKEFYLACYEDDMNSDDYEMLDYGALDDIH